MVCVDIFVFIVSHEKYGIAGGCFGAHGCAAYLDVVVAIELKVVQCEHHLKEFDDGGVLGFHISFVSVSPQCLICCPDALVIRDVGVEASHIKGD